MTSLTRTDTARMPSGMTGGRPAPASFDASLAGRIGSFSTIEHDQAAADERGRILRNGPSGTSPAGELDDGQVLAAQLGAEREVGGGDDDGPCWHRDGLGRQVLHEVVGAIGEPASGDDGDEKH